MESANPRAAIANPSEAPDHKPNILSQFADNLRKWRNRRGLSQKALAEKTGLGKSTIMAYEGGKKLAGIDKLEVFANALECSVVDLLGDDVFIPRSPFARCAMCFAVAGYEYDLGKPAAGYITLSRPQAAPIIMTESQFINFTSELMQSDELHDLIENRLKRLFRLGFIPDNRKDTDF